MKKLMLLAITVLSTFSIKAGDHNDAIMGNLNLTNSQTSGGGDKKFTLGISVGAGIPMGAYGSKTNDTNAADQKDTSHINHGYASTGFHFDITAGYLFAGNIGGMILIGGNMNSFDAATYESANGLKLSSGESYTVTSYYVGQYLVGPFLSLPVGDKLKIDIRLLVGLVTINHPTSTYTSGSGYTDVRSGTGASAFGYHFGAGIKYNLSDAMGLTFNLAYTGSNPTYTSFTDTQTFGNTTTATTNNGSKISMSVGLLTAAVGVAFNL